MDLHCAIKILVTKEKCLIHNDLAEKLLLNFVNNYQQCYGNTSCISYNVHGLIHLPYYVMLHGPLDTFLVFKYENFLQKIKKFIKNSRYPLQEIYNRILEHNKIQESEVIPSLVFDISLNNEKEYNFIIVY